MARQAITHRFFFNLSLLILLAAAPTTALAQQRPPDQLPPPIYPRPTVLSRPATQPGTQPAPVAPVPDATVPDYETPLARPQGTLVETLDGKPVMEQFADVAFN